MPSETQPPAEAVEPTPAQPEVAEQAYPEVDALGRSYATGRRKNAKARLWLKSGAGSFQVNGRPLSRYFARETLQKLACQPMESAAQLEGYDVFCTVKGGGLTGQAGAVRHAVARALCRYDPSLRPVLKARGLLTRDSRVVERKKYGRPKARKSFQFSKR